MTDVPVLLYPSGAYNNIVNDAYDKWSTIAQQAFVTAQNLAGDVANIPITQVTFDAAFDPQAALAAFPTLAAPTIPATLVFNPPAQPPTPPSPDLGVYQPAAAPTFDGVAPSYAPPAVPIITPATDPGAAPVVTNPDIPDAPVLTFPDVPVLAAITVPTAPALDIPTFTVTPPTFDAPLPNENFTFSPGAFTDDLLGTVKNTISQMLTGSFVLPPDVVTAMRNRAYEAANEELDRASDEIYSDFSARGFNEPNGLLNKRLAEARNKALTARSGINRDVYIQDQTVAIENMRAAVTSGVQLEGQMIQLYTVQTQLQFDSAKYAFDVAVQIYQARISAYNAQVQQFNAQAEAYRTQIVALQAQAQIYATEMEGARIQGELNLQQVQVYTAQLDGIKTMVEVYQSQVSAAEAIARNNLVVIQGYTAKVQAFSSQIEAQNAQWMGYKTQVDAQLGAAQFYQTSVNGFGELVRAYATGETNKRDAVQLQLAQGKFSLDRWQAQLQMYDAQLRTELSRFGTVAQTLGSEVDIYKANAQIAEAAGSYDDRRFQLYLAQEQAIVDTSLKRADANFEQLKYTTSVLLEIKKTIATVQAQLTAAAMNAVNIGATLSANNSESVDYGLSVNYSGSMDTTTP